MRRQAATAEEGVGMHRRIPVLRRFGAMSFGLGWFEDGVWVDHATEVESAAIDQDGPEWAALHAWFSCCGVEVEAADTVADQGAAAAGRARRPIPVALSSVSS
jgi:hypothetical protein